MSVGSNGLELTRLEIKRTELEIDTHYNDDFKQADRTIKKRLNREMDKGIILLHGEPGTGKTTYIKHLIANVTKDVIFMPPNIAANLTSPDLMTLLLDKPNSILVIEDAENIVTSRDHKGGSPVSALLNLSDGILSDCLNIQIICSFNTDLRNVDNALLRKGRLIAKYEFSKLDTGKANTLSRKLGYDSHFTEPQVLTDVFNQEETFGIIKVRKVVGFR
jgi:ATP-dependent 26S proteasome regulatory subunit